MFKILLVEDESNLRMLLTKQLEVKGFVVDSCENGIEAINKFEQNRYDLLISDIMMPLIDGNQLIRKIKTIRRDFPIIVLTALENLTDKKLSFESGADDYLTKPVNIDELVLRIYALMRRYNLVNAKTITHKNIKVDYNQFLVTINNQKLTLPKKEFLLLYKLVSNPGHIYSREELLQEIWGLESYSIDRTIDVHINKLREKIITDDLEIQTVRGLGYKVVLK